MLYGVVLLDMQRNVNIFETASLWEWKDLGEFKEGIMVRDWVL